MAQLVTLREALQKTVHDGDAVALEGFTHLIPFAAGHELLHQGRRELELIRMTPAVPADEAWDATGWDLRVSAALEITRTGAGGAGRPTPAAESMTDAGGARILGALAADPVRLHCDGG